MTEADVIQPSASTASVGKGIRYIGNWAYAYSGTIPDGGSGSAAATLLSFTTGAGLMVSQLSMITNSESNANVYIDLQLNGSSVFKGLSDDIPSLYGPFPVEIIIPPFTEVLLKWGSSGSFIMTATLTGRVYGAE